MRHLAHRLVPAGLVLLASSAAADTLLVASDGSGAFISLQDAVNAATDGDVLLVREGIYGPTTIDDVDLTISGVEDQEVRVTRLSIQGLSATRSVRIDHLSVGADVDAAGPVDVTSALVIDDCAGSVSFLGGRRVPRLTGGFIQSPTVQDFIGGSVFVRASQDVTLTRLRIVGPEVVPAGMQLDALTIEDSRVALYEVDATGGDAQGPVVIDGGDGVVATNSFVALVASVAHGGRGAVVGGASGPCGPLGEGGDGVMATGSEIWRQSADLRSGFGGVCLNNSAFGNPGQDLHLVASTTLDLPGTPPEIFGQTVLAPGGTVTFDVTGEPGAEAFLARGPVPAFLPIEGRRGVFHLSPADAGVIRLGSLDENGKLHARFPLPVLSTGTEAMVLRAQVFTQAGPITAGQPIDLVVLPEDPALPLGSIVHVDGDAPAGGDGASWATAYRGLLEASLAVRSEWASRGDVQFWIAEGTYSTGPLSYQSTDAMPIVMRHGTSLLGGFAGGESSETERDPAANTVTVTGLSPLGGLDYPLIYGDLMEGRARLSGLRVHCEGWPGVLAVNSDLFEIDACLFEGDPGVGRGFAIGIQTFGQSPRQPRLRLMDVDVVEGPVLIDGGTYAYGCRFIGLDRAGLASSKVFVAGPDSKTFECCEFTGCVSESGAALRGEPSGGGAIEVIGCTFTANEATRTFVGQGFGGIVSVTGTPLRMSNCIVHGNLDGLGVAENTTIGVQPAASFTLQHSSIEGWNGTYGGVGNADRAPGFVDPVGPDGIPGTADDDLELGPTSACLDAGDITLFRRDRFDLDGDGDRDEHQPLDLLGRARATDQPAVPDTGAGPAPRPDLGARERP